MTPSPAGNEAPMPDSLELPEVDKWLKDLSPKSFEGLNAFTVITKIAGVDGMVRIFTARIDEVYQEISGENIYWCNYVGISKLEALSVDNVYRSQGSEDPDVTDALNKQIKHGLFAEGALAWSPEIIYSRTNSSADVTHNPMS